MKTVDKELVRRCECLLETVLLSFLFGVVWKRFYRVFGVIPYYGRGKYVIVGIYAFLTLLLFFSLDCYKFGYLKSFDLVVLQCISIVLANFFEYCILSLVSGKPVPIVPLLKLTAVDFGIVLFLVLLFNDVFRKTFAPYKMLMICGDKNSLGLQKKILSRADKYNLSKIMFVSDGYDAICTEIENFDAVIINDIPAEVRNDFVKFCYDKNIRAYITPKISDVIIKSSYDIALFDSPLYLLKNSDNSEIQHIIKRLFDIFACFLALIIFLPVMLFVAVAIKLEDGGPVFYRQERVTKGRKKFKIIKFRSMVVDAEKNGGFVLAKNNDDRITKVGRFIRACRLDELPQLFNIIRGDMSIVGPRPERMEFIEKFEKTIPEFRLRTKVKGGLTGFAQVYGKYNTSPYDKLRLDLMYIENFSLLLDIKLILLTVATLFKKESTEGF